jgi:hypothetical protein
MVQLSLDIAFWLGHSLHISGWISTARNCGNRQMLKLALAAALLGTVAMVAPSAHADWTRPECSMTTYGPACNAAKPLVFADDPNHGITFSFVIRNNIPFLAIVNEEWSMPVRNGLTVTISVDRSASVIREATTNGDILGIVLEPADLDWLMEGNRLYVTLPGGTRDWYSLVGTRDAFSAVAQAYLRFARKGSGDPFAAQQQEPRRNQPATVSDPFQGI